MSKLPVGTDPNVLVGHAASDDAGVYRISGDTAIVMTVDYFTPIVDDAYDFGRVAATNSLSDVYAMGGRPVAALNIAGFPEGKIPEDVLGEILRGGADQAAKAGIPVLGGHTVNDQEVKYGLAVVGYVHPDRMVTNAGARPGDKLILTKPVGTGTLATALKNEKLDDAGLRRLVDVMTTLNRDAAAAMLKHHAHACTDITGFGLAGHAHEMAQASDVTVEIHASAVPLIEGALESAADGNRPGGAGTNRAYLEETLRIEGEVDDNLLYLMFDPQTAGGLLIALDADEAEPLLDTLHDGHSQAAIVGECREAGEAGGAGIVISGRP
jgi:selenide,water dikinase